MTGNERIVYAYKKGYRIDKDGNAISPKGNKLKFRKTSDGYYAIVVRCENELFNIPYHRLMAYQKFGDLMFMADCVRHINGNNLDNSYCNIEIGTYSENMMDIPQSIRMYKAINATKIKYDNVEEIRKYYDQCHSYKKTMQKFGISSKGTLHFILNSRIVIDGKEKVLEKFK